jgi:hypothetical protein
MHACARTINEILCGKRCGPFTENFKSRAPDAIRANQVIEVWATAACPDECRRLQRSLNGEFDTIGSGWANKLD